jgi:hypothetical protein
MVRIVPQRNPLAKQSHRIGRREYLAKTKAHTYLRVSRLAKNVDQGSIIGLLALGYTPTKAPQRRPA